MKKYEISERKVSIKYLFERLKDIPTNLRDPENKIRMLVGAFPFLERALFNNQDKEESKKILEFISDLKKQIDTLDKNTIKWNFLETQEFYNLFKKTIEQIKFEYKEERIKLFRNFLLNSLRKDKPEVDFHYFLDKIRIMKLEHFEIIEWYHDNNYNTTPLVGSDYDSKKPEELNKISKYWASLENDLYSLGFLSMIQIESKSQRYILNWIGLNFFDFIKYDEKENNETKN